MIILRRRDLYYISDQPGLEKEVLVPKVPTDFLTRSGYSDYKLPRIVVYPSVDKALLGFGLADKNLKDQVLYIYQPLGVRSENIIKPGLSSSPISMQTNESWITMPIRLKYIASIKITRKGEGLIYHYGPRSTEGKLNTWEWKEILQPWEKKGKLL